MLDYKLIAMLNSTVKELEYSMLSMSNLMMHINIDGIGVTTDKYPDKKITRVVIRQLQRFYEIVNGSNISDTYKFPLPGIMVIIDNDKLLSKSEDAIISIEAIQTNGRFNHNNIDSLEYIKEVSEEIKAYIIDSLADLSKIKTIWSFNNHELDVKLRLVSSDVSYFDIVLDAIKTYCCFIEKPPRERNLFEIHRTFRDLLNKYKSTHIKDVISVGDKIYTYNERNYRSYWMPGSITGKELDCHLFEVLNSYGYEVLDVMYDDKLGSFSKIKELDNRLSKYNVKDDPIVFKDTHDGFIWIPDTGVETVVKMKDELMGKEIRLSEYLEYRTWIDS